MEKQVLEAMDAQMHWDNIYSEKTPDALGWYTPRLNASLTLIERTGVQRSAGIIDAVGGESTLVDDLLDRGYEDVTVSRHFANGYRCKQNIAQSLEGGRYHSSRRCSLRLRCLARPGCISFPYASGDRVAYVRQVSHAIKPGGYVMNLIFRDPGAPKQLLA
jgi:hypothetical protein